MDEKASIEGVLGGFPETSPIDCTSSRLLLIETLPYLSTIPTPHVSRSPPPKNPRAWTRALDVGAGIGRVTQGTLLPLFDSVDLVEPSPKLIEKARELAPSWKGAAAKRLRFHELGAQHCDPRQMAAKSEDGPFDAIWIQWCVGHLTDNEFAPLIAAFLEVPPN